jgi:uncharacterized protein (TIGR03437 family)
MSIRSVLPAVVCLLAFGNLASAQNQYVAFHSGAGNPSTNLYIYLAGTLQPITALNNVSGGTFQILPMPDGTKYYLIANGGQAITAVEGNFTNPRTVAANFSVAPSAAALQPDGRRLILAAGKVYFLDTNTDTVLNPNGLEVDGQAVDVVVNFDSTRAYILSKGPDGPAGNVVTMVDLVNNFTKLKTINFPGNSTNQASGLIIGPNGLLYVTAQFRIYEIKTLDLTLTSGGELPVRGFPGKAQATTDGRFLIFGNKTPVNGGYSVGQLDLSTRTFSYDGASTQEVFSKFFSATLDASPTKLYAFGSSGRLYDVTLGSQVILDRSTLNTIFAQGLETPVFPNLTFSGEVPPRTLWVTRNNTNLDGSTSRQLIQVDIANQNIQTQNLPSNQQLEMTFLSPGITSGGNRLLAFNTAQTVVGGTPTPLPLVARLIDSLGRGVYRGQITFSSANPAVTITSPQNVTGVDGWAQTYVTVPNIAGSYTITASGGPGVPNFDYTITVPGIPGGGGGTTQGGIFIFTGQGQIAPENFTTKEPLTVQVLDAAGTPIIGQKVVWTAVKGFGPLAGASIENTTDQEGKAYLQYTTGLVPLPLAAAQDIVEAATTFGKVTFYITTVTLRQPSGQTAGDAQIEYIYPNLGDVNNRNITIAAGGTLKNAVGIRVADYQGQPLENVGLQVTTKAPQEVFVEGFPPPPPPDGFTAKCNGSPLTDPRGNVSCDIVAGNKPGTSPLYVLVGNYRIMSPLNLTITVGKASKLRILAGNAQKVKANTTLPIPLQVQVTDLGGNPIVGSQVTWSRVGTVNFGSFTAERTASNSAGVAQNTFRSGVIPGKFQLRAQIDNPDPTPGANPIFLTFDVEIDITVNGIIQLSGNAQSVGINSDFPNPLVVQVNDLNNLPLSGVRVEFAAIGSGSVTSNAETTDALGRATVRAKSGTQAGPLTVTATAGTFQTTFSLTVLPPTPVILGTDIVNSASGQVGLTPCGLATISGRNLLPGFTGVLQPSNTFGQLPITLGPIQQITIGGVSAPILRVVSQNGKEQVDIQTPCETQPGTTQVVVNVIGQTAATINSVPVTQFQPGIFEFDGTDGRRYALAVKADGSFVGPTNPAERGQTVRVLMTGLGQTSPALGTNRSGVANQTVTASLIGGINDAGVRVVKAETVFGQIGNYLVEIEIPADTAAGPYQSVAVAVILPSGELVFSNGSFIPIR